MSKLFTIAILIFIINLQTSYTQPWHYDFGTSTGIYTTSGPSTTFLPVPPTDSARVRIGVGGSFNLENQSIPFGSNSFLRMAASSSTSVNKFSVYDYSPSNTATIRFIVRLGNFQGNPGIASGNFQFFLGNGATYSDNSGFNKAHNFAGIQFVFGSGGSLATSVRNNGSWSTTGITSTLFNQGTDYIVEIYANNSTTDKSYTYGSTQTLAPNTWDLWINGEREGNDLAKDQLPGNTNIDSYMFIGQSSTGNVANIFLDEFDYHNDVAGTPLPVTLTSFNVTRIQRNATLTWSTSSEINNAGFEIERSSVTSSGVTTWSKTAFIQGNGTTNEPKSYIYEDKNLSAGKYSYRLKQIDFNGNYEYFNPSGNSVIDITKPAVFTLSQNYPNPSNPVTTIDYHMPFDGFVNITVYDITGKAVKQLVNTSLTADFYSVIFDGSDLSSGIYFYRITVSSGNETFSKSMKMLLIK